MTGEVRIVECQTLALDMEPGDGTRYEFLVTRGRRGTPDGCLSLTRVHGVGLRGDDYSLEDVGHFVRFKGPRPGYDDYQQWAERAQEHFLVHDVATHLADGNHWTALAGVCALVVAAQHWRML